MNVYQFTILLIVLATCGFFFAGYLWHYERYPHSTWKSHIWQWTPLAIGAICFMIAGKFITGDTSFALYGQYGVTFFMCGAGYVVGRKYWFELRRYS